MIGPEDERIVMSAYFGPDYSIDVFGSGDYTEAVEWADAKTGETIARSAFNASTAAGSLVNIGYGGRIYTMGNNGQLFIYQVEPAEDDDSVN